MSSGKSGNGCSTVVGVVLVGLLAIGCITALVLPLLASAFGNVAGFAMGLVVWGVLLAIVGLAASVSSVAIQHGICWGLRRGTHSLTPSQQVGWASMSAVLVALLVAFSAASMIAKKNGHQISNTPGAIAAAADGDSWSEILDRGIDRGGWGGARVGFWAGVVLGSIVFLWSNIGSISVAQDWAEQAYAMRHQSAATATAGVASGSSGGVPGATSGAGAGGGSRQTAQPPPPPVPPQSSSQTQTPPPPRAASSGPSATAIKQVEGLIAAAALQIEVMEQQILPVTDQMKFKWHDLAQSLRRSADINVLANQPIQDTHDLVKHHQAVAADDLRELQDAALGWENLKKVLSDIREELVQVKAEPIERSELMDFINSSHDDMKKLLLAREWKKNRQEFTIMPELAREISPYRRAAEELGFADLSEVNKQSLSKQFRWRSTKTHSDFKPGPDATAKFDRAKTSRDRLRIYLQL